MPVAQTTSARSPSALSYDCLDFPGRDTVTTAEIAAKLGLTPKHVCNLVDEGALVAINCATRGATRSTLRVPVESYRDFIVLRLTGPRRGELLAYLPPATLRALHEELAGLLGGGRS